MLFLDRTKKKKKRESNRQSQTILIDADQLENNFMGFAFSSGTSRSLVQFLVVVQAYEIDRQSHRDANE